MLKEGTNAPAFKTTDQNGETVSLKDLRGQKVVLYFYPKDDTPGCTKEACGFRDALADYDRANVAVLGISPDEGKDVTKFSEKFHLNFPRLADADHAVAEKYGAWQQKSMYGKKYMGINRTTFLIDEQGKIAKIFDKVNVSEHADEVLEAFGEK